MNTKEQKVKLLEAIAAGTTTIESIQPVKLKHWFAVVDKPGLLFCKEDGSQHPKDQLPRGLNVLNIIQISGGQPQRNNENQVY